MAVLLSGNNMEEEYMWSCSLDKDNKEFEWMPEDPTKEPDDNNDEEKDELKPGHRLLIKNAILMQEAEKDVVNVVQIECEGYNNKKVIVPVVAMRGQVDYQRYVDLLVPSAAKIKLLSGDGPIHLIGSHCVDYDRYRGQGEGDAEESEEEDVEMEEGDKKKDLRNKLNEKESKKKEAKKIETKSMSELKEVVQESKKDKGKEVETETKEDEKESRKRKASADPTPEKEKKIKTGSAEKKEKRKSK